MSHHSTAWRSMTAWHGMDSVARHGTLSLLLTLLLLLLSNVPLLLLLLLPGQDSAHPRCRAAGAPEFPTCAWQPPQWLQGGPGGFCRWAQRFLFLFGSGKRGGRSVFGHMPATVASRWTRRCLQVSRGGVSCFLEGGHG
jgi:hypothetical protein